MNASTALPPGASVIHTSFTDAGDGNRRQVEAPESLPAYSPIGAQPPGALDILPPPHLMAGGSPSPPATLSIEQERRKVLVLWELALERAELCKRVINESLSGVEAELANHRMCVMKEIRPERIKRRNTETQRVAAILKRQRILREGCVSE